MINIVIVEDQTIVREGLERLLEFSDQVKVVGCAANGEQALALLASVMPDVILLDIQMPVMDGLTFVETASQRLQHQPLPKIILLTTFDDHQYLLRAQQLNVQGFLLKDVCFEQLIAAIQAVHAGKRLAPLQPLTATATATIVKQDPSPLQQLTPRELEIFTHICAGMANKEVARTLSLSEGTVKNHVSNILSKLGVRDRTQAVVKFGAMKKAPARGALEG